MKIKSRWQARPITMAVMAIGLLLSAQVLVAGGATAGAASGGNYGDLTTGYDLSEAINPIEFDPDPVHQLGMLLRLRLAHLRRAPARDDEWGLCA